MKRFLFIPLLLLVAVGCDGDDGMDGGQGPQGLTPIIEVIPVDVGEEPCAEAGGSTQR